MDANNSQKPPFYKTYATTIIWLGAGIAGLGAAWIIDDLRASKVDLVGASSTAIGVVDFLLKRRGQHTERKMEVETNKQTGILLEAINSRLDRVERDFDTRHEENQHQFRMMRRRMSKLEAQTDARLQDFDKNQTSKNLLHMEHDRRLTRLEAGHEEIIRKIDNLTDSVIMRMTEDDSRERRES